MERNRKNWKEFSHPAVPPGCKGFHWGDCRVFAGKDPDGKYHLSISTPHRYPTWEEIKSARYELMPHGVTMAMILPPMEEYVNIHPNCFHLYEINGEGRILL